jgi:twitching motility protein PilU
LSARAYIEPDPGLRSFLEHMGRIAASDLYLTAGSPPLFRVDDVTYPGRVALEGDEVMTMAHSLMSAGQREQFHESREMNLAFSLMDESRFRANLFWQRGVPAMVVRRLHVPVRTLVELGHPPIFHKLAVERRGLVLVVGGNGSGKSTTLAAMVDHRNVAQGGHILTVEDPVEFVHAHKQCIVTQREIGVDTRSYAAALASAPRQTADLILIGEIGDAETMETALSCADDALCLSTVRAGTASQAVARVLSFFPAARQAEIGMRLSQSLRAVIAQRLLPGIAGGRVASFEVLLDTPRVRGLVRRGDTESLAQALEQDCDEGCCSFDAALVELLAAGRISQVEALRAGGHASDVQLRLQRLREPTRAAEVTLRMADDPYEPPAPASAPAPVHAPPPERRSKVGPVRP